jgi:hypothetical protein
VGTKNRQCARNVNEISPEGTPVGQCTTQAKQGPDIRQNGAADQSLSGQRLVYVAADKLHFSQNSRDFRIENVYLSGESRLHLPRDLFLNNTFVEFSMTGLGSWDNAGSD